MRAAGAHVGKGGDVKAVIKERPKEANQSSPPLFLCHALLLAFVCVRAVDLISHQSTSTHPDPHWSLLSYTALFIPIHTTRMRPYSLVEEHSYTCITHLFIARPLRHPRLSYLHTHKQSRCPCGVESASVDAVAALEGGWSAAAAPAARKNAAASFISGLGGWAAAAAMKKVAASLVCGEIREGY